MNNQEAGRLGGKYTKEQLRSPKGFMDNPELASRAAKSMWSKLTPEQRSERANKAAQTRAERKNRGNAQ